MNTRKLPLSAVLSKRWSEVCLCLRILGVPDSATSAEEKKYSVKIFDFDWECKVFSI